MVSQSLELQNGVLGSRLGQAWHFSHRVTLCFINFHSWKRWESILLVNISAIFHVYFFVYKINSVFILLSEHQLLMFVHIIDLSLCLVSIFKQLLSLSNMKMQISTSCNITVYRSNEISNKISKVFLWEKNTFYIKMPTQQNSQMFNNLFNLVIFRWWEFEKFS